jgi:hypothetical protein
LGVEIPPVCLKDYMKKKKIDLLKSFLNFTIDVDLFRHRFDFYIGEKEVCADAVCKKYHIIKNDKIFIPEASGECLQLELPNIATVQVVWVCYPDIELVTHEVDHAVNNALNCSGIQYGAGDQEVHAYYIGWLVSQVFKKVLKEGCEICA